MDKLLLPLRYHWYRVCIITLEKAIKRVLEFVCTSLFLSVSTAVFNTAHLYLLVQLNETIAQVYFWKWKTATVFTVFTWTLHKPAGSTVQCFWFIISSVGGCEMRLKVGAGGTTKIFCTYLVHCSSNLRDGRSGHLRGLQVHLFTPLLTDLVLLPCRINYFLCLPAFSTPVPPSR